jgi:hypothetical protein
MPKFEKEIAELRKRARDPETYDRLREAMICGTPMLEEAMLQHQHDTKEMIKYITKVLLSELYGEGPYEEEDIKENMEEARGIVDKAGNDALRWMHVARKRAKV